MIESLGVIKALSDETRYQLVLELLNNDLCVGALAQRLGISAPSVSQHLGVLRKSGLVKGEKRGYWTYYVVERQAILRAAEDLRTLTERVVDIRTACSRSTEINNHQAAGGNVKMCTGCSGQA